MTKTAERVLPDTNRDLLDKTAIAHLATARPDGQLQSNPVWYEWDGERLMMSTTKARRKYKNLVAEPHTAVSITDPDDQYRYLQVRGQVEHVEDDPTGAFYQTLQQRYRGYTSEVKDRDVRVILTIRPTGFKARN